MDGATGAVLSELDNVSPLKDERRTALKAFLASQLALGRVQLLSHQSS